MILYVFRRSNKPRPIALCQDACGGGSDVKNEQGYCEPGYKGVGKFKAFSPVSNKFLKEVTVPTMRVQC